jgi:hypothetical protein
MQLVRIHPPDDDWQASVRQSEIVARLDALGPDAVQMLYGTGGLPTNWDLIVRAWMKEHER